MKKAEAKFIHSSLLYFVLSSVLCMGILPQGFSQKQSKTDSLLQVLQTAKEDTTRIKALNTLARKLKFSNSDTAIYYAKQAMALAEKAGLKTEAAQSLINIGNAYLHLHKYDKAIDHFRQSLKLYTEIGNRQGIAMNYVKMGDGYYYKGKYEKALKNYLKSIKINEQLENKKHIAYCMIRIASIYYYQKNYEKSIELYTRSIKLHEELNNKSGISFILNNLGLIYHDRGKYDKALKYYIQSLNINEELENQLGIADSYNHIGDIYDHEGNYKKSLEYYFKSLKIYEESDDKYYISNLLNNIGIAYKNQGDYKNAIIYSNKSLLIARDLGIKQQLKDSYENLAESHSKQNNYQDAYIFHQLYSEVKDTLLNEENTKQMAEMSAKYESEKKKLQIENLNKEKKLQATELKKNRIMMFAFAGGFALVLVLALVIFRGYRQKKKANRLLEEKNTIIEEKNKDITDSIRYAQNIQEAILPNEAEIKKVLPEHFIYFQPRDIVSGDFYWFTKQNGKIYIAACDCTGHGVPGAFVSMIGNDLLNQIIIEKGIEKPGDILTQLNNGVKSVFTREGAEQQAQDGMDMALCVFDKDLKTLEFAGANNPFLLIQNGELKRIKGDKHAIGGDTEIDYKFANHKIGLQKGNTIYIFSDGFQDQFGGPNGKKFMSKRFRQLFIDIQTMNMEEQKEHLNKTIEDWKEGRDQVDDILVIGIRI